MSQTEQDGDAGVRKHLYLLVSHPDEELEGLIESREKPYPTGKKNEVRRVDKRNLDTGDGFTIKVVGLGYHDFQSADPDGETFTSVAEKKLAEIDDEHLREAGMDPEEVGA